MTAQTQTAWPDVIPGITYMDDPNEEPAGDLAQTKDRPNEEPTGNIEGQAKKPIQSRKSWAASEDEALKVLVAALGVGRWADLARRMGEERTGKQCRERWHNHLSPVVDKQDWTEDEDRIISGGVARLGSKCVTCPHPLHLPISPSYPRPTQLYPTSLNDAASP